MATSTEVSIRLAVEGARKSASDLGQVDAQLDKLKASVNGGAQAFARFTNATSLAHVQKLKAIFADTGIAVNTCSRQVAELVAQMQRAAREDAFARLGREANLSAMQIARLRAGMGDMRGAMSSLGAGLAASKMAILAWSAALIYAVKSCIDAQIQLQRLEFAYKSIFGASAQAQLRAVYEQTDRVGLKYAETAEAAKNFFAAGQGTRLAPQMQEIFRAVSNAGAALQLSTDDLNHVFMAFGQMISKGNVQAEELRGQLGERLPGAFQLAAKAMGLTTAELGKLMEDGKLTAEELLPKLARVLEEQYGAAAEKAADTVQGAINRMDSEWTQFKANLLNSEPAVFAIKFVTAGMKAWNHLGDSVNADNEAETALKKAGIVPEGGFKGFWRQFISGRRYTPEQLEFGRILQRQNAYLEEYSQNESVMEENILGNARKWINDSLKGTNSQKLKEAKANKETALKAIKQGRSVAVSQGSSQEVIAQFDKDYAAVEKAWDDKIKALQDKADKTGTAAARAASRAAVSEADYNGELERTIQQIESIQQQLGLDKTADLAKAKIEIERRYQAEISKTQEQLAKAVARGSMTQAQADELSAKKAEAADLQRQLALKEAQAKADDKATKSLQVRAEFYKELGRLSGEYGLSLEYQEQLILKQAQAWALAGVSIEDIDRRMVLMRQEISDNAFDGLARGARKFGAEYGDVAAQVESFTTQMGSHISNTLANAFMRGKFSAQEFFSSLVAMAAQAATNAFIGKIFSGIGNLLPSSGVGKGDLVGFTYAGPEGGFTGPVMKYHTGGYAGLGAQRRNLPLAAFANAPRFHSGGGFFGQDEYPAILLRGERVLNREETRAYDAQGVSPVYAGGNATPVVNINIANATGAEVEAQGQARPDGKGGFSLDILLSQVEQGLVARAKSGKSQLMQYQEKAYGMGRAPVIARGRGRA